MKRAAALLFVVAAAACASSRPPQELVDARAAYARAYVGPAVQANPAGLVEAHAALDEAERKYAEDPTSEEARHLAYVAHRRILLAETNARAAIAAAQRMQAEHALAEMRARTKPEDERGVVEPPRAKAKSAPEE